MELFWETWTEQIDSRKVEFDNEIIHMGELQSAAIQLELEHAADAVNEDIANEELLHEALRNKTPYYHPLMARMFRRVEEGREALLSLGFIHAEYLPLRSTEARAGSQQASTPSPYNASRSSNPKPLLKGVDFVDIEDSYDADVEEDDDNLPNIEGLGIGPAVRSPR